MTLFIQAFKFAAEPFFFSHSKTTDKRTLYATVMDYFVIICLALFLVVTLFIDVFKQYIDVKFHEGLHVVPILLLANMFLGVYYNLSIWYKLSDNNKIGANIAIMGAVITLVLNFIWIPIYGYDGSAWTTFICYFSMMVVCYLLGKKYYPIDYHVKKFAGYTVFALFLFYIGKMTNNLFPEPEIIYSINAILLLSFFALAFIVEKRFKTIHNI